MPSEDTAAHDLEQLTSDQFRDVIGRFASGVTVITVNKDGKPLGTTASAFTSLSVEPPMILICMNKTSATGRAVHEAGKFAVNILGEGHPDLAIRFAGKGDDKFEGVEHESGANGEPLLVDALATLECAVTEETTGGTHLVFLAAVERASAKPGSPLTYFRGQFGRFEVVAVTLELMEDGLHARAAIELGVVMQRAGNITDREIAGCERLLDKMDQAESGPLEPWIRALEEYLEHFVSLAGSPSLLETYRRLNVTGMISSAAHTATAGEDPPKNATATHRRVLKAMANNDPQASFGAIQRQTEGTIRALRAAIEKAGGEV
jgi:flavin reductase (DIM6/NTAB) family NADH-FMN oxidoreductase RutF